jgi:hypothetical protein
VPKQVNRVIAMSKTMLSVFLGAEGVVFPD